MLQKKYFITMTLLLVILLAACAKASQPANPTLTLGKNTCNYSGPNSVHIGEFTLNIVLPKQNPLASGFALVTLQNGKTITDLKAWPSTDPPGWLTDLDDQGYIEKNTSFTYNLTQMDAWHSGEPLYLVCFQMDAKGNINKIGAFGPINVKP